MRPWLRGGTSFSVDRRPPTARRSVFLILCFALLPLGYSAQPGSTYAACSSGVLLAGHQPQALDGAIQKGDLDAVESILESSSPQPASNVTDGLAIAVQHNQAEIAAYLIAHGANVNTVSSGKSPVQWAVRRDDANLMELLIKNGARTEDALEEAVSVDDVNLAARLFALGANLAPLEARAKTLRETPLAVAIRNQSADMVTLLLSHNQGPRGLADFRRFATQLTDNAEIFSALLGKSKIALPSSAERHAEELKGLQACNVLAQMEHNKQLTAHLKNLRDRLDYGPSPHPRDHSVWALLGYWGSFSKPGLETLGLESDVFSQTVGNIDIGGSSYVVGLRNCGMCEFSSRDAPPVGTLEFAARVLDDHRLQIACTFDYVIGRDIPLPEAKRVVDADPQIGAAPQALRYDGGLGITGVAALMLAIQQEPSLSIFKTPEGHVALLNRAVRDSNMQAVQYLLSQRGFDVNADPKLIMKVPGYQDCPSPQGQLFCDFAQPQSPLQIAAKNEQPVLVRLLINAGADPNPVDGNSALSEAVSNEDERLLKVLLDRGAIPSAWDLTTLEDKHQKKLLQIMAAHGFSLASLASFDVIKSTHLDQRRSGLWQSQVIVDSQVRLVTQCVSTTTNSLLNVGGLTPVAGCQVESVARTGEQTQLQGTCGQGNTKALLSSSVSGDINSRYSQTIDLISANGVSTKASLDAVWQGRCGNVAPPSAPSSTTPATSRATPPATTSALPSTTTASASNGADATDQAALQKAGGEYIGGKSSDAYLDFLALAKKGNPTAQNVTGALLEYGEGTTADPVGARNWFEKSASNNRPIAMSNLAYLYQQGIGVSQSLPDASKWYRKAAAMGEIRGQVMAPVIEMAINSGRNFSISDPAGAFPDSVLLAGIQTTCDQRARRLLSDAEQFAPLVTAPRDFPRLYEPYIVTQGRPLQPVGRTEFLTSVVAEYAASGCFLDVGRILDAERLHGKDLKDSTISSIVRNLVRLGQIDRALAFAYSSAINLFRQKWVLGEGLAEETKSGDAAKALNLANTLRVADGTLTYPQYGEIALKAAQHHDDATVIRMLAAINRRGLDGHLMLAVAYFRQGKKDDALAELKAGEEAAIIGAEKNTYYTPFDDPLSHLAAAQAVITPDAVDATVKKVTQSNDDYRLQVLLAAIEASDDRQRQLHWLSEVDVLSANVQKSNAALSQQNVRSFIFICDGAGEYAALGDYQRALRLLDERGCNEGFGNGSRGTLNIARVMHEAVLRNDIPAALQMLPKVSADPRKNLGYALLPQLDGLLRAKRYDDALNTFQDYLSVPNENKDDLRNAAVLVMIVNDTNKGFPYDTWVKATLANSDRLSINRWDLLRLWYSSIALHEGGEAAATMANQYRGSDRAAAEVGVVMGLHNESLSDR